MAAATKAQASATETAEKFLLFVSPGCSSCLKAKEFMMDHGIDFTLVDVENDPAGREHLKRLGVRNVPIVVKGGQFVSAKRMDVLAKFVGVHISKHVPLPPEVLIERWEKILRAAQRYVRQLPADQLDLKALHTRGRPLRVLCHHIFRLGEVYLLCVIDGEKELAWLSRTPLEKGTFTKAEEIINYGDEVIANLKKWWDGFADKSCRQGIEITDYGVISIHQLLERCTWHSAHHTRQIADLLERQGIEPDGGRFTEEYMAGLPLPKLKWD